MGSLFNGVASGGSSLIPTGASGIGGTLGTAIGGQINPLAQAITPQNQFQASVPAADQQNALAAALLAQSQGQGPNPAQAMLNQETNRNIQQNAGFLASQKGINPALAARQASLNQAGASQEAAGQGAIMNAEQQLAAQGQLGNLYNQENQAGLQAQGINANVAAGNAAANQRVVGGLLNGGTSAISQFGGGGGASMAPVAAEVAAKGGEISKHPMPENIPPHLHHIAKIYHPNFKPKAGTQELKAKGGDVPGKAKVKGDSPKNDTVKTMLSPGEMVIPRSVMNSEDPAEAAKAFVADKLREKGGGKDHKGDFKEALKNAIKSRKVS